MSEIWKIRCSSCNISEITTEMPDGSTRLMFLDVARKENPDWKVLEPRTICSTCQGKQTDIELSWEYKNKIHSFIFEKNKIRVTGTLKNNKKKVGRILILKIVNDGEEMSKSYDCSTIGDGKEMAVQLIGNILRG